MGIQVNMSAQEASSKTLEPIPSGWYKVAITGVDLKESKSQKNFGKPYYAIEFTVQEGEHEGRKIYTNAMCFPGALYTIVQIMNGTGVPEWQVTEDDRQLEIPEPEELIGHDMYAKVSIQPKRKVKDPATGEEKEYDARNDTKGFKPLSADVKTGPDVKTGSSSLLPS